MALLDLIANITWLSAVLFIIGFGLCVLEMFSPGFSFFGLLGILSLAACIFVTAGSLMEGIILTAFIAVILLIMFGILVILVSKGKLPNKLIARSFAPNDEKLPERKDFDSFMGKTGIITAACRPSGNADFDGERLDVISSGEPIDRGEVVEVIEVEGSKVVVKSVL